MMTVITPEEREALARLATSGAPSEWADAGRAADILRAVDSGVLPPQESIEWFLKRFRSPLEALLGRIYSPPELFICEEVELGGGYHTLWVVSGPERDWSEPYQKSSQVRYRRRVVRVEYPPKHGGGR